MNIQRLEAMLATAEAPFKATPSAQPAPSGPSFGDVLTQAINTVEQDQINAREMSRKLVTGEVKDVAEVMIASERASLSLGLALQVRNKLLEAYQEIMRMPL